VPERAHLPPRRTSASAPAPEIAAAHGVLALQKAIGNRGVNQLLRTAKRAPTPEEIARKWRRNWKGPSEDCWKAATRITRLLGGKFDKDKPLHRFKNDIKWTAPGEAEAARSRGLDHPDVFVDGLFGTFRVHSGRADQGGGVDSSDVVLRPGMLIYTAENAGMENGKLRWTDRHMMMYAGDVDDGRFVHENAVFENFVSPRQPRNLAAEKDGAYAQPDQDGLSLFKRSFVVGLAIWDPFAHVRKDPLTEVVGDAVEGARSWLGW